MAGMVQPRRPPVYRRGAPRCAPQAGGHAGPPLQKINYLSERNLVLQAISKPVVFVILNEVKDLNLVQKRDSSRRSQRMALSYGSLSTAD